MKNIFLRTSVIFVLSYGAAIALHLAGYFAFDVFSAAAATSFAAASAVIAITLGDYRRKPRFRMRRQAPAEVQAAELAARLDRPAPDWTYTTRQK